MKKTVWCVMLAFACSGCVTVANSVMPVASSLPPAERVTLGMTYAAVAAVMDARVVVGYEIVPSTGATKPIETQSLYSSEIMKIKDVSYKVDKYIVHSPAAGAHLVEADLFPVVYKDGLVVAKGREGLAQVRVVDEK